MLPVKQTPQLELTGSLMSVPLIKLKTNLIREREMHKIHEVTRGRVVSYSSRSSQPAKLTIALWCYRLRSREVYNFVVFHTTQHRPSVVRNGFHCRIAILGFSRTCIYSLSQDDASLQYQTARLLTLLNRRLYSYNPRATAITSNLFYFYSYDYE